MKLFNYLYFKLHKHDIEFLIYLVEQSIKQEAEDESNNGVHVYICCEILHNLKEYIK